MASSRGAEPASACRDTIPGKGRAEDNGPISPQLAATSRCADGRQIALAGIAAGAGLSALTIAVGLVVRSTSSVATGIELADDVLAWTVVLPLMSRACPRLLY
jgi:hypothetical protein